MADCVLTIGRDSLNRHLNAAEVAVGKFLRRIVSEKILSAEFVADLTESIVELRQGTGVEIFSAGVV